MLNAITNCVTSLKLTLVCLAAAMALIFAGTIAQVHIGIHEAQQRYFQSLFVWWPASGALRIPIFPGGHFIGAVLLVNLIAAHLKRFHWSWRKLGIHLTHGGLIIMLAGGLFTDLFATESYLRLGKGETKSYSEDRRAVELAVTDTTSPSGDVVTAVPQRLLETEGRITHPSLPFAISLHKFLHNSQLRMVSASEAGAATQGEGARVSVERLPEVTAVDEQNTPSAIIEIQTRDTGTGLGTWLVSTALGAKQSFTYAGHTWELALRPVRYYKPFAITLNRFSHDVYPGTEIPKNFSSHITLSDRELSMQRDVLIYMNHPLRYRGETFYQAGFEKGDRTTVLQVVHNPTFLVPYVACIIVALGLLIQFGYHLLSFSRRVRIAAA
jgi:hypothetical protein